MALTEADIIRLDLHKSEVYIKEDDVTYESISDNFWQNQYVAAMQTIENQNDYIKSLKERLAEYE